MKAYCEKMDSTHHIMRHAHDHDAVYHPILGGIPPSTEKLLQSFLKSTL